MKINARFCEYVVLAGFFLVLSSVLSCSVAEKKSPIEIAEYLKSSGEDYIILDLRDLTEYKKGHVKGAINIPFRKDTFAERISSYENDKISAVFYCGQGIKTKEAENLVKKSSFKKIYIMEGGFMAWKNQGLEIAQ